MNDKVESLSNKLFESLTDNNLAFQVILNKLNAMQQVENFGEYTDGETT